MAPALSVPAMNSDPHSPRKDASSITLKKRNILRQDSSVFMAPFSPRLLSKNESTLSIDR